jgi:excisionase family DNA binding protein
MSPPGESADSALLLTINEAADRLALSRATVQRLVARGDVPTVTIGRARRVAVHDLHAFVSALPRTGGQSSDAASTP